MKLFIDTANIEEIREIASWGILSGVTTNPSLIAKEGKDFVGVIKEIAKLVNGPISAEVVAPKAKEMVEQGQKLSKIDKNIVIKVPMTEEGLKAISRFKELGIKTNCTLVFSANQAMLAARAGASFVSPFIGRVNDIGNSGIQIVKDIVEIFDYHEIDTEVIAASIRTPMDVTESAIAGSNIATIPYGILKKMVNHPLTDMGNEKFIKDWDKHNK